MKKILLLAVCIASSIGLYAQTSGGPDLYGNVWRDSNDPNGPTFNWIDITTDPNAIQVMGLQDDNVSGPFSLPAPFQYYWYQVTNFYVGSNGYIAFNPLNAVAATHQAAFPTIPVPDTKNNFCAAMMSDLNFENNTPGFPNVASCWRWTSPGNDSVIVSFLNVPFWVNATPAFSGDNTFQIILAYNDSTITYQYLTQSGPSSTNPGFVSVGIENGSGNDGLNPYFDTYPATAYAIKFYPPVSTTLVINDASTNYGDNLGTGAVFVSKNVAGAHALKAEIANVGNTVLNPFNTTGLVRASNNALQVTNTASSDTLQPGQTQLLNFANPFIPVNAGTFRFITTTTLGGDAFAGNDIKTQEIQVVDTTLVDISLSYDNGTAAAGGISWSGGNGGCANHFIPPFYPADLTKASILVVDDPNLVGYHIKVFADDGPNNSAGTLLDSVNVAPGFAFGTFVNTDMTTPIRIDSGGFYIAWIMNGDGVALGQNQVPPFSNRSYEILGSTMAGYRSGQTEDLMIRANISRVGVGIDDIDADAGIGQFFPNPARDKASIVIDAAVLGQGKMLVQMFDIKGSIVSSEQMNIQNGQLEVNLSKIQTGLYTVRFVVDNKEFSRKLQVTK
ncbi:MAG: T9SS type A sorting domain-containing protein [Bacteroidetes bacterium]|nr:T9SS type A sorting domain-containing protein [Bacteroidota bacterium]